MVEVLPRSAWTTHARPASRLVHISSPRGFAVHWPGTTLDRIDASSKSAIAHRIEGYRQYHVDGHGWTDIAYGAVVDQAGRIWDARGLDYRSAANGDQAVNRTHGAVLLLVGKSEAPSSAMIDAVRWLRTHLWLPGFPHASAVVGHRDLWSTDCPGPHVYPLVTSGAFTEAPSVPAPNGAQPKGDQMTLLFMTDEHMATYALLPSMRAVRVTGGTGGLAVRIRDGGHPKLEATRAEVESLGYVFDEPEAD